MPIAIGIGGLLLGFVAMLFAMIPYRDFFRRKPYIEVAEPGLLEKPVEHAQPARWYPTFAADRALAVKA